MSAPWQPPARLVAVDGAGALEPAAAARLAGAALSAPGTGVLLRPSPAANAILAALPPPAALIAVLPDMPQLLRDAAQNGIARAAIGRLTAGGATAAVRLALTGVRHLRHIAAQDFRGLVPTLIELERASLGSRRPDGVALAAPLTDLLLAAGNGEALAHVVDFLRRRVGVRAGLETLNLGHLLPRLAEWGVAADFVVGPVNSRGFRMKPTPAATLAALRGSRVPVLASELTAGQTVAVGEGAAYARAAGAAGVVMTIADLAAAAA